MEDHDDYEDARSAVRRLGYEAAAEHQTALYVIEACKAAGVPRPELVERVGGRPSLGWRRSGEVTLTVQCGAASCHCYAPGGLSVLAPADVAAWVRGKLDDRRAA